MTVFALVTRLFHLEGSRLFPERLESCVKPQLQYTELCPGDQTGVSQNSHRVVSDNAAIPAGPCSHTCYSYLHASQPGKVPQAPGGIHEALDEINRSVFLTNCCEGSS